MELLIGFNAKSITSVDKELDELFNKAKSNLSPEQFISLNGSLDKDLESLVKDIQRKHINKLTRDQNDLSSRRIYYWKRHINDSHNRDRSMSIASNHSIGDASVASSSASVSSMVTPKRKRNLRFLPNKRNYSPELNSNQLKVINLSNHTFSFTELDILSKGLMFCPTAKFDCFTAVKDLHLFARKLLFKRIFHDKQTFDLFPTEAEQKALTDLEQLSREHNIKEVLCRLYFYKDHCINLGRRKQ
ncbi:uncharacterized protein [Dendrobates tinctorius]